MKAKRFFAALGVAMLVSGVGWAEEPQRGGTLNLALTADIRSLDASRNDSNTDTVLSHIYESLVGFRTDMTVGPVLAESWDVSADGKTYAFKIKPGAVYHNGDKVAASDFKWLWDRRMASAANPEGR